MCLLPGCERVPTMTLAKMRIMACCKEHAVRAMNDEEVRGLVSCASRMAEFMAFLTAPAVMEPHQWNPLCWRALHKLLQTGFVVLPALEGLFRSVTLFLHNDDRMDAARRLSKRFPVPVHHVHRVVTGFVMAALESTLGTAGMQFDKWWERAAGIGVQIWFGEGPRAEWRARYAGAAFDSFVEWVDFWRASGFAVKKTEAEHERRLARGDWGAPEQPPPPNRTLLQLLNGAPDPALQWAPQPP
jgi:hypothetical protein